MSPQFRPIRDEQISRGSSKDRVMSGSRPPLSPRDAAGIPPRNGNMIPDSFSTTIQRASIPCVQNFDQTRLSKPTNSYFQSAYGNSQQLRRARDPSFTQQVESTMRSNTFQQQVMNIEDQERYDRRRPSNQRFQATFRHGEMLNQPNMFLIEDQHLRSLSQHDSLRQSPLGVDAADLPFHHGTRDSRDNHDSNNYKAGYFISNQHGNNNDLQGVRQ